MPRALEVLHFTLQANCIVFCALLLIGFVFVSQWAIMSIGMQQGVGAAVSFIVIPIIILGFCFGFLVNSLCFILLIRFIALDQNTLPLLKSEFILLWNSNKVSYILGFLSFFIQIALQIYVLKAFLGMAYQPTYHLIPTGQVVRNSKPSKY
jgi:hypothetical protein